VSSSPSSDEKPIPEQSSGKVFHAIRVLLLLPFLIPFLLIQVTGDLLTAPFREAPAFLRIFVGTVVVTAIVAIIIARLGR
jgi:hypothetical protein